MAQAEAIILAPPAPEAQPPAEQQAVATAPEVAPVNAPETAPQAASAQSAQAESNHIVFSGSSSNLVPGIALMVASALAFSMNLTDVFFAEAMAWTFAIWGALLVFMGLLDSSQRYTITDDALNITNPVRFWGRRKEWYWGNIRRMEIVVKKRDEETKDVVIQVYYHQEGEAAIEREDRAYDPALAQLIIERAGLRPADKSNPRDLTKLPTGKATYTWMNLGN